MKTGTKHKGLAILTAVLMVFAMMPMMVLADGSYTVTLTANPPAGGTVSGGGTYSDGYDVLIFATASDGYRFVGWKREDGTIIDDKVDMSFRIHENRKYEAVFEKTSSYTLEMPDSITITPNNEATEFMVNVSALDLRQNASGKTPDSFRVKIDEGKLVNQSDAEKTISFKMNYYAYTSGLMNSIWLNYENAKSLSGFIIITNSQWGSAAPGIYKGSMTYQPYYHYPDNTVEWIGTPKSVPITLTIPGPQTYTATVNGGTGGGDYAAGATVTITANAAETGKQFKEWTTEDGVTFANATAAETTFEMPAKAVTVTATYEDIPAPPEPVSIRDAEVLLSKTAFTFNGAVQKPEIKTIGGKTLTEGADYVATWSNASSKNAGTYSVTITGKGDYTGTAKATYTISKATNPLSVTARTATLKAKKLKKKTQKLAAAKVMTVSQNQGAVSYKLAGVKKAKFKKYFKVDARTGKVTVKKKLKKGKYKLTISVTAAGSGNYNAATKTVIATVKVK